MNVLSKFWVLLLLLNGTGCTRCSEDGDTDKADAGVAKSARPKEQKQRVKTFLQSE
jgi:hypothetical protein